jgi:hypothetical protein
MHLARAAARRMNHLTERFGVSIVKTAYLHELASSRDEPVVDDPPDGWVHPPASPMIVDTQWLDELRREYQSQPLTALGGTWNPEYAGEVPLTDFRGDNHYVWQRRLYEEVNYLTTILYANSHDPHGVLQTIDEDGAFGAEVLEYEGRLYSRDLVESANEINFLLDFLPIEARRPLRLIDVGAGYGRLAHRLSTVVAESEIFCVDGIAESTAICDAYIKFRGLESQVHVVPLTRLASIPTPVSVATNVYSFSEMSYESVAWWLDWLVDAGVQFLFIVPNLPGPSLTNERSYRELLDARGFHLWKTRRKYDDPLVDRHGLYPGVYYLFRRT